MKAIERIFWVVILAVTGCGLVGRHAPIESPSEAARHTAALATVIVANGTLLDLTIAFKSATAPSQNIVIGRVAAGHTELMAPVPAGEPIVLIAREPSGGEFALDAKSMLLDTEWTWEIPRTTTFVKPPPK